MGALCFSAVHTIAVEGVRQQRGQVSCHLGRLLILFHNFLEIIIIMFHKTLNNSMADEPSKDTHKAAGLTAPTFKDSGYASTRDT